MGTLNFSNAAPWLNEDNTQQKLSLEFVLRSYLSLALFLTLSFLWGESKNISWGGGEGDA